MVLFIFVLLVTNNKKVYFLTKYDKKQKNAKSLLVFVYGNVFFLTS